MRKWLGVGAVAVLTGAGSIVAPARAAGPNTRVRITFVGGPAGVVTSTGAISAVGVATEETALKPDGSFTGTLTFAFPLGTVKAPYSGEVTRVAVDPTCTGRFTTAGRFEVVAGTGRYAGISGHGKFTESGIFSAVPTVTGCSPDLRVRTYLTTDARATVNLPPGPLGGLLG